MNKLFWNIDPFNGEIFMELYSRTPRDAALKAATRNCTMIHLVEVCNGKLHIFRGEKQQLEEKEHTSFTKSRNITAKPIVSKLSYRNLNREIKRTEIETICSEFKDMTNV